MEFEEHLKNVRGRVFVEIAVVGFGEDHDNALKHYYRLAEEHDHIRVTSFTDNLDPTLIVRQLVSLIDPNAYAPKQNNNLNYNTNNNSNTNNNLYNNVSTAPPFNPNY